MKLFLTILTVIISLLVLTALLSFVFLKWVRVVNVTICEKKILNNHKIVLLSDLHNFQYGEDNQKLVQLISNQKPEYILIAGDLLVDDNPDINTARKFLSKISELESTIIYTCGNHEIKYKNQFPELWNEYLVFLKKQGIIFLNDSSYETEDIYFSGYTNKIEHFRKFRKLYPLTVEEMREQLPSYDGDKCNFLIAHHPDFFSVYCEWGADRVVSGHLHGGIVRLPFIGGLLTPQTFFGPKYDFGTYYKDNKSITVTAGLGVHTIPLRLFNRPDITVINLIK